MKIQDYLQEIAVQRGLTFVPSAAPFKADPLLAYKAFSTVMGVCSGYLVAISALKVGNETKIGIMVRFPKQQDVSVLTNAVKEIPGVKSFLKTKSVKVEPDSVQAFWGYAFKPPKSAELLGLFDSLLSTVSTYVPAFGAKCEECGAACSEIMLRNDVPGYHCQGCQIKSAEQQAIASREYAEKPANYAQAAALALVVALACGVAEGLLLFWLSDAKGTPMKLWAALAILIGLAVGKSFAVVVKKIDVKSQGAVVFLLTLLGSLVGNLVFFTLYVAPSLQAQPSFRLAMFVLTKLHVVKFASFPDIFISVIELAGAGFAVYVLKLSRPQFKCEFRPLQLVAAQLANA